MGFEGRFFASIICIAVDVVLLYELVLFMKKVSADDCSFILREKETV